MVALPGAGRKTANVVLGNAFDVPGITVAIGEGGTLNGDQFKIRGFDAKDDSGKWALREALEIFVRLIGVHSQLCSLKGFHFQDRACHCFDRKMERDGLGRLKFEMLALEERRHKPAPCLLHLFEHC